MVKTVIEAVVAQLNKVIPRKGKYLLRKRF